MFLFNMPCHIISFVPFKAALSTLPPFPAIKIATLHKFSDDQIVASYNKILSQKSGLVP